MTKYKVIKKWPDGPDVGTKGYIDTSDGDMLLFIWDNKDHAINIEGVTISDYFEEVKEEKKLPKTWEEIGRIKGYYVTSSSIIMEIDTTEPDRYDKGTRPTRELAESSLALAQLMQLRDIYRDGWIPTDNVYFNIWYAPFVSSTQVIDIDSLSFPTRELRDQFQANFKDLIEQAHPLFFS